MLLSLLVFASSLRAAVADVPDILEVSANPIIDCAAPIAGRGFAIVFTVRHADPTVSHYVDKIEAMTGRTANTLDLQPQSSEVFTATMIVCESRDYQRGQEFAVQARAHCTTHGWGSWSSPITVPEFESPILVFMILVCVIIFGRLGFNLHVLPRCRCRK
jgi:hypothetical protein